MDAANTTPPTHDDLLQHTSWLRGLARTLIADPHSADDHVQETLLEGMRAATVRSPRAWLATVLRRKIASGRARSQRVEAWEKEAARSDATPSSDELVSRAQTSRKVIDAVLGLDEPYRQVVLLRFYEDLPPREIATRLERNVGTVKVQLNRGLQRIRRSLDASHGNDGSWKQAVAPLALGTAGRIAFGKLAAAAAVVVAIVATGSMLGNDGDDADSIPFETAGGGTFASTTESDAGPDTTDTETSPFRPDTPESKLVDTEPLPPESILVVDENGKPIAGRSVRIVSHAAKEPFDLLDATTDERGIVDVSDVLAKVRRRAPTTPVAVAVRSVDHELLSEFEWDADWEDPLRIAVERGGNLSITIVDEAGNVVPDLFQVSVHDSSSGKEVRSARGERGHVRLDAMSSALFRVHVRFEGDTRPKVSGEITGPDVGQTRRMTLVAGAGVPVIAGTLVHGDDRAATGQICMMRVADGKPVANVAMPITRTDSLGRFRIPAVKLASEPGEIVIQRIRGDWRTATLRIDRSMLEGRDLGTLTVSRAPVVLAGRVLEADGKPVIDASLELQRPDPRSGWTSTSAGLLTSTTRSDATGRFEMRSWTEHSQLAVEVHHPNGSWLRPTEGWPRGTRGVEMRFPPSGGIAGSVLLDDSVGLELVKLRLVYSENHWVSLPRLNAFARFEKTGLHLGEARLDVLFDDEVVHTVSSVHIAQGVTRRIPAIDLRSIVRAVGITVTDAEGRPLSRAEVRTVPVGEETETRISVRPIKADADGRISIPWPKDANEVWVSAHHGGKLHGISRIDLTGPEVVAHLTTPAPIRVHIPESVDLGNGGELTLLARPLHEKTRKLIAIFNKGPDGNVTTMRPISSNERTHVFRLPLPGRYDVQARLQVPGEAPVEIADETRLVVGKKPIDLPRR